MDRTLTVPYDESFFRAENKIKWVEKHQVRYIWQGTQPLITRKSKLFRDPVHQDTLENWLGSQIPDILTLMMFAIQERFINRLARKTSEVKFMVVVKPINEHGGWRLYATAHAYRDMKYVGDRSKATSDNG